MIKVLYKRYSWKWFARPMLDSLKDDDLSAAEMKIAKREVVKASKRCAEAFAIGKNDAASGRKKVNLMKVLEESGKQRNYPFKQPVAQAYELGYLKGARK